MSDFHFLRPWWFLALVPAILMIAVMVRGRVGPSSWRSVIEPALLERLWLDRPGAVSRWPLAILGLGWLLAILALAGPVWERQPAPVWRSQVSRILILDLSPSMNAADLAPSRLERARFKIIDVLDKSREGRTGLVVFAGEPHTVAPLTEDGGTITNLLGALSTDIVPAPGDAGAPALALAADLLRQAGDERGDLLLLSDGLSDPAAALAVAGGLRKKGYRLSVLGVGTPQGAPVPGSGGLTEMARLEVEPLAELARAGGGAFSLMTTDDRDLRNLLFEPDRSGAVRETGEGVERWIEKGAWLLPVLLVLGAAGFRRGWLVGVFAVLILPPPAKALEWRDLWLRQDQQAVRALRDGQAEAAAKGFSDPAWRGMALYEAGDYQAAARAFAESEGVEVEYNRGNALARAGRLAEAAAAYRDVLSRAPEHGDAKANLALVEDLLRQQEQQHSPNREQAQLSQEASKEGAQQQQSQSRDNGESQQPQGAGDQSSDTANTGDDKAPGQNGAHPDTEEDSRQAASGAGAEDGERGQEPQDSPESVRRDVMQQAPHPAGIGEEVRPPEAEGASAKPKTVEEVPSEAQLAMEQWLRQIPEDPAGLLRRKFMLEHLRRREERR